MKKASTLALLLLTGGISHLSISQSLTETASPMEQAAPAIAEVLLNLEHAPSDEQKERLHEISTNEAESTAIRTIAEAAQSFEHAVQPDYLEKLKAISQNEYATAREKTLADVLLNMRHMPDAAQTGRLAEVE